MFPRLELFIPASQLVAKREEKQYNTASVAQALLSTDVAGDPCTLLSQRSCMEIGVQATLEQVQEKSWALKGGWSFSLPPKYFPGL